MGQNFISIIPDELFLNLGTLDKLFLFSNNLEELNESSLNGLINLTSLLINNNMLKEVHPNVFGHTPKLQKLYVIGLRCELILM